ncbi:MAG: hypothetical protein ABSG75_10585 [Syntrophales bacterium]|jgi:hypothetical protein
MYFIDYLAKKPTPFIWAIALLLNLIIGVIDYLTGYEIGMEVFYLMPIGLLSWLVNRNAGLIMSVISTVTFIIADLLAGKVIQNYLIESWNILVHVGFFIVVVYLITEEKIISDNNKILIGKLQKSVDEIKTLSGLLPMCFACEKIRDDDGYWKQIEHYISEYTDARFSHSICPDCKEKLYPGLGRNK